MNKKLENAKAQKKSTKKTESIFNFAETILKDNSKNKKSKTKKVKKEIKSFGVKGVLFVFLAVIVGVTGGYFVMHFMTQNDSFEMIKYSNGETDVYIGEDEIIKTYDELGVVCKAFGKDITDKVNIQYLYREDLTKDTVEVTEIDKTKSGIYYAVYTCSHIKYKTVTLIRNIIVMGVSVND